LEVVCRKWRLLTQAMCEKTCAKDNIKIFA
jgi:hypothetical protein